MLKAETKSMPPKFTLFIELHHSKNILQLLRVKPKGLCSFVPET
uniref:Uncharacterized protein n=1 Tax=Arundo donax TaxID=35708 RepID=A0A0A8Y5L5_ARUDO